MAKRLNGKQMSNNTSNSWVLVAITPELNGLAFELNTNLRIGRSERNDIVIDSPHISRIHAKINRIGSKIFIQDLESAHGTYVNGKRLGQEAVRIKSNDELMFGNLLFIVQNDEHDRIILPINQSVGDDSEIVEVEIEEIHSHRPTHDDDSETIHITTQQTTINPVIDGYANVMLSNTIDLSAIADNNNQPITANISAKKPKKPNEQADYPNALYNSTIVATLDDDMDMMKKPPIAFMIGAGLLLMAFIALVFLL